MNAKVTALIISLTTGIVFAETNYEFTPQLLLEAGANQRVDTTIVGNLFVEKMEAGFELGIGEKLTALTNVEYNAEDEGIELNEAKAIYQFTDIFSLSAGKLVNNFGSFESEALTDPLIKEFAETKSASVQFDFVGEKLYGGVTAYNGIMNNNFGSFVPAIGFALEEKLDFKISARTELFPNESFTDLSANIRISPIEKFAVLGELYIELNEKPIDSVTTSKLIGSMGELDFYPTEKWTIFGRFDHLKEQKSEFTTMMVQAGAGFNIVEQLRAGLSFDMNGAKEKDVAIEWIPAISAELKFEL